MPAITVPEWFDAAHYASQKVNQMNAIDYAPDWLGQHGGGAQDWTDALYLEHLKNFGPPVEGTTPEQMSFSNFLACNAGASTYADRADINLKDINVSPNAMFDIPVYLQQLANQANAADAGAGATMQTILGGIFTNEHSSVWDHYSKVWDKQLDVNPSNAFDTRAYLEARAAAMNQPGKIEAAIDEIKKYGLNPVEDYFIKGRGMGISADSIAVEAGSQVNPAAPDWTQWGGGGGSGPVAPDPFEANFVTRDILPNEFGPYTSEAGKNTQFSAVWTNAQASTLSPKDVIRGGANADNSLVVELGRDFGGFDGVAGESAFAKDPSDRRRPREAESLRSYKRKIVDF